MARLSRIAATVIAVVLLGLAIAPGGRPAGVADGPFVFTANQNNNNGFTMTGSVTGLYPGAKSVLVVYIKNTNQNTIYVTQVTVTAGDVIVRNTNGTVRGTCYASNLSFTNFVGHQAASAGGPTQTGTPISIPISVASALPDICQGVTWNLTFTGTASST